MCLCAQARVRLTDKSVYYLFIDLAMSAEYDET